MWTALLSLKPLSLHVVWINVFVMFFQIKKHLSDPGRKLILLCGRIGALVVQRLMFILLPLIEIHFNGSFFWINFVSQDDDLSIYTWIFKWRRDDISSSSMGRPIGPLLYERGPQGYMLFNLVALALHEVTYKASSNAPAKHIGNKRHPINSSKLIGKR